MQEAQPFARTDALSVEAHGHEVMIHDGVTNHFHTLNPTAAAVWRACDGTRTSEEIGVETGFDAAIVAYALDELAGRGLLAGERATSGLTRRDVVRRLSAAGIAGTIVLPTIASITGIDAASAATACATNANCPPLQVCNFGICGPCVPNGSSCSGNLACCSGFCSGGTCRSL